MFHFGRDNDEPEYAVLIDIGSGSVGVAIAASTPDKKYPLMIYTQRITTRITENTAHLDANLRRIRETLFTAALTLSQDGYRALTNHNPKAVITKLYVTCSSPWAYTVSRNVRYESDNTFKITRTIIEELIQSAEVEILAHLREISLLNEQGFDIVERATVDTTVNDYSVTEPLNLKGTTISLSHIAGAIPKKILEFTHEIQDKLFQETELKVHTYMLVMYCVMRDIFPKLHSVCVIDVTGEATEFGIIENNFLVENTYTAYGSNTFVREIMQNSGKPVSDVHTQIQAFSEKNSPLHSDLDEYIDLYKTKISAVLNDILTRRLLPNEFVITSHKPYEAICKHILELALKEIGQTESKVTTIDSSLVSNTPQGTDSDIYLTLSALFFHNTHRQTRRE